MTAQWKYVLPKTEVRKLSFRILVTKLFELVMAPFFSNSVILDETSEPKMRRLLEQVKPKFS